MSSQIRLQFVTGTPGAAGADGAPGADGVAGAGGNSAGVNLFEDFLGAPLTATGVVAYGGPLTLAGSVAGTGAALDKTFPGSLAGHPGVIALRSGTAADANVSLFTAKSPDSSSFLAGSGIITFEMLAQLTAVNNPAAQKYHVQFGLSSTTNGTVDDDGLAWFEYGQKLDDSGAVNSGKVLCHALDQTHDSGVTPTDVTWTKFKIVVAEDGQSVEFFINEVSVGTITVDLDAVDATVMANITKVGGTTNRALSIDYLSLTIALTTDR